jgi:hypothetical protein
MEGTLDADEFAVAERLGLTVDRLRQEMPNNEYHQWRAYLVWKAAMLEKAQKEAETRGKRRSSR